MVFSDPRPLTTEPLPLDLVNTEWIEGDVARDLFAEDGGLRHWLDVHGFRDAPDDDAGRGALVEARASMRGWLIDPGDVAARDRLDAVLARGAERTRLGPDGPQREVEAEPAHRVAWEAAVELVRLRERYGERVRPCANSGCVLWFVDVSRPGTRRWCSMSGCGNREKARRHYAAAS